MNSHDLSLVHTGTVIEEDSLTLGQLCRACGGPCRLGNQSGRGKYYRTPGRRDTIMALFLEQASCAPAPRSGYSVDLGLIWLVLLWRWT